MSVRVYPRRSLFSALAAMMHLPVTSPSATVPLPEQVTPSMSEPAPTLATGPKSIRELFGANGQFEFRSLFRFNVVTEANLRNRRELLELFVQATPEDFFALSFAARANALAVLKREYQRYKGTATRTRDSEHGRKGEPLPKLSFPTPTHAVQYRELLERASTTIIRCSKSRPTHVTAVTQ